jgi:hypothetical protein
MVGADASVPRSDLAVTVDGVRMPPFQQKEP